MFRKLTCFVAALCVSALGVGMTALPASAVADNGKVLVIMMENHSYAQMQANMPYLNNISHLYTYFDNYFAIEHPSQPNYFDIAFGDNMGKTSDSLSTISGETVFGQAANATAGSWHGTAKTYAESMTSNCQAANGTAIVPGSSEPYYARKHNPWASAGDEHLQCAFADVPQGSPTAGALHDDAVQGTLPNVSMVVPNQCNDAHSCPLSTADAYLQDWLPVLMNGPDFQSGKLAIVVTADEDDRNSGNRVLTTVINNNTYLDGVNHTTLNHYSLSGFLSDATGSPHLRNAATAPNMRAALGFPAPK